MSATRTTSWRRAPYVASVAAALAAALVAAAEQPAATALEPPPRPVRRRLLAIPDGASGPVVRTTSGFLEGERTDAVLAFRGIPFAAPPVGELRWRPPQPPAPWSGGRAAAAFGPPCPQIAGDGTFMGDEDCLYLNVWTPANAPALSRLPVLFFIHGGGNVQGSASEQVGEGSHVYDGAALATDEQVVVVTTNYRLGALGFLTLPALAAESPQGSSGNYGILDQEAALAWVQANIAAFGGDPAQVMVFGESAGAVDTCMVLVSPLAAGLFSSALMESGGCAAKTAADAQSFGAQVVAAAGCAGASDVATCMRALDATAVTLALPQPPDIAGKQGGYQPNIDAWVLPESPLDALADGQHNHVPLVVGANSDETSKAVGFMTESQYEQAVLALAGGSQLLADTILAEYPSSEYGGSPRSAYVALTSDAKFICTARSVARAAASGQSEPVFRYYFTHPYSNGGLALELLGAFHGIELPYVFGDLDLSGYTPTSGEQDLGAAIQGAWARLAAAGDPNGAGALSWPAYVPATDPYLDLDVPITTGEGVRTQQCDFWDALAP
jgi:para-nitrobenzyl esterase